VGTDRLEKIFGGARIAIAREHEFAGLFPDCDTGAMPPFGNLYGLEVYVDEEVASRPRIVFQAGNHHELATMSYADFARLVEPKVAEFCSHA
jgi:Ala-tRNA(Pro) deacylase